MAGRCQFGPHDKPCSGCNGFVSPTQPHHHVWRGSQFGPEQLCADCTLATVAAAVPILRALQAAGLGTTAEIVQAAIQTELVVVGLQLGMDLDASSTN